MRQVHLPAHPQPHARGHPRRLRRGRSPHRRQQPLRPRRRPRPRPPPGRHGLPAPQPLPHHVHPRQRPRRRQTQQHPHVQVRRRRPRGNLPQGRQPLERGQGPPPPPRIRPLRRTTTTPLHRPRHRRATRGHPHGRTLLRPRPHLHPRHRGPHRGTQAGLHHRHRHPQHATSIPSERQDRVLQHRRNRQTRQTHRIRRHHHHLLQALHPKPPRTTSPASSDSGGLDTAAARPTRPTGVPLRGLLDQRGTGSPPVECREAVYRDPPPTRRRARARGGRSSPPCRPSCRSRESCRAARHPCTSRTE